MFTYPYQTTVLSGIVLKTVIAELMAAASRQDLIPVTSPEGEKIPGLFEVPASLKDLRPFAHPIQFESFGRHYVVIDTRSFTRTSESGGQTITNQAEYNLARMRGMLTLRWAQGGQPDFLALGDLPARVFTSLVTAGVVRRLGLSPQEFQSLLVLTAFYYYSQFAEQSELMDESMLLTMVKRINRVTRVDAQTIMNRLEGKALLTDMQSFCDLIRAEMPSPRLQAIQPALLFTMISGIWYGASAREIVAVSMEYPPYFLAMCYIAATDRGYNKSYLGKEVITAGQRHNALADFVRAVDNYVGEWAK